MPEHDLAFEALLDDARRFIAKNRIASSTRTTYETTSARFARWCDQNAREALPASEETLLIWATVRLVPVLDERGEVTLTGIRPSSLLNEFAAIRFAHEQAGLQSATTAASLRQLVDAARRVDDRGTRRARPLTVEDLRAIVATPQLLRSFTWRRDVDITLVGFFGALRSSDLRRLRVEYIEFSPSGARVRLPSSKTDQLGHGADVMYASIPGDPLCPVEALRRLSVARQQGWLLPTPLANHDQALSHATLKQGIERVTAVIPPDRRGRKFTTHSMRRGFCTTARRQGASLTAIALKARMSSWAAVIRYVELHRGRESAASVLELLEFAAGDTDDIGNIDSSDA